MRQSLRSHAKTSELLHALNRFHEFTTYDQLVMETGRHLKSLIACEGVAVFEQLTSSLKIIAVSGDHDLADHFSNKLDLVNSMLRDHPLSRIMDLQDFHATETVLSDTISPAEYRRHPFYQAVLSRLGYDEAMLGQLFQGAHRVATLVVFRKGSTFLPREREIFRQLLLCARLSANNISDGISKEALAAELCAIPANDSADSGLVFIRASLQPPVINDVAKRLLSKHLDASISLSNLLTDAFSVTRRHGWRSPLQPIWAETKLPGSSPSLIARCLAMRDGTGTMRLKAVPNSEDSGQNGKHFDEGEGEKTLTNRQSAVLFWVSEGKCNDSIAQILGISRRTVEKHLQTIFHTLGVENRMAAAMEYLRRANHSLTP